MFAATFGSVTTATTSRDNLSYIHARKHGCDSCKVTLKSVCYDDSNRQSFLVEGYLLTCMVVKDSGNALAPAFCKSCWEKEILKLDIVQNLKKKLEQREIYCKKYDDENKQLNAKLDEFSQDRQKLVQKVEYLQLENINLKRENEKERVLNEQKEAKISELTAINGCLEGRNFELSNIKTELEESKVQLLKEKNENIKKVEDLHIEKVGLKKDFENEKTAHAQKVRHISELTTATSKLQQDVARLEGKNLELSKIRTELEESKVQLLKEKNENIKKIENLQVENISLESEKKARGQRETELVKENSQLRNKISVMSKELEANIITIKRLMEDLEFLKGNNDGLSDKITEHERENRKLSKEKKELEEQKSHIETISDKIPTLSVLMDSLMDLNGDGWSVISSNYDQLMMKKMITVAVIGMYDVGKSWFCNELSGNKISTSGSNQRTEGLNFFFPEEKENLIGIVDTPGSFEAIRCTEEARIEKFKAALPQESNIETLNESSDKLLQYYKCFKNDARIMQSIKECFIRENADVLILICNKLSENEQENMFKVIKHHKKMQKERKESDGTNNRDTLLYIVHNYKMLSKIEDVKVQIKRDLKDTFGIEEEQLFATASKFKECNNKMYKDQDKICHLILAANASEAGKYYNPPTFEFLSRKIDVIDTKISTDVKKRFFDFCCENIPKILKQDQLRLQWTADKTAIVKTKESPNIVLKNLRYDELGNFTLSTAFEPKYSRKETKRDDNTTEVMIEMDVLDSDVKAKPERDQEGSWFLKVWGNRKLENEINGNKSQITHYRDRGPFEVKVRLLNGNKKNGRREPTQGTINGIVKWYFEFGDDEEPEL